MRNVNNTHLIIIRYSAFLPFLSTTMTQSVAPTYAEYFAASEEWIVGKSKNDICKDYGTKFKFTAQTG